jgi:hypothetical protein
MRNFPEARAFYCLAMNTEEQDDLWRLLGKAGSPSISPFFSRNVVRAARESQRESWMGKWRVVAWLRGHLRSRLAIAAVGACAVLVSGVVLIPRHAQSDKQIILLAQQFSTSPDYQVVNHLDELLDSEKNSVWLDN